MFIPYLSLSTAVSFLTGNRIINAAVAAWLIAQVTKVIVESLRLKKFVWRRFFVGSGGMPSSHSACVCAATVAVARVAGIQSVEFGISAIFAFIVIFDAVNVRRAAGEHSHVLNVMIQSADKQSPELFGRQMKELLGHTPLQVFVGMLLGVAVGFFM